MGGLSRYSALWRHLSHIVAQLACSVYVTFCMIQNVRNCWHSEGLFRSTLCSRAVHSEELFRSTLCSRAVHSEELFRSTLCSRAVHSEELFRSTLCSSAVHSEELFRSTLCSSAVHSEELFPSTLCSRAAHSQAHKQLLHTWCVCADNHVVPPVPVAALLLRLWVWIPPEGSMLFSCECCVLSGRGLWDGLITRPGEFYRLWCVVVYDLETSWMRKAMTCVGPERHREENVYVVPSALLLSMYQVCTSIYI